MTAHQTALLNSLSSQTPQSVVADEKPARTLQEDTRPARRTNVICRDYKKGLCHNQDCPRAHVLDLPPEMLVLLPQAKQRTPNVQVAVDVHPSVRTSDVELCKLNLVGKCPRGNSCRYSHDLGPVDHRNPRPEPVAVAGPSRLPDPRASTPVPPRVNHALPQKSSTDEERGSAVPSTSSDRVCPTMSAAHTSTHHMTRIRTSSSILKMSAGSTSKDAATSLDASTSIGVLKRSGHSVRRGKQTKRPRPRRRRMWLRV
ncbi:hypothetical protein C8T65DRAFT_184781 [Cerioporus squamosus]|nr:hypothetical protein C8T65DRAFT_184781 [Cerioporus squamosus]